MDLNQLRDNIDDIDSQILSLFMKRMELCKGVAEYKKIHNMPVFQGGREQQIIDRIKALTNDPNLENGTAALFTNIMDIELPDAVIIILMLLDLLTIPAFMYAYVKSMESDSK